MNTFVGRRRFAAGWLVAIAAAICASVFLATGGATSAAPARARSASPHHDVHDPEWTNAPAAATAARLDADTAVLKRQNVDLWGWSQDQASPAKLDVWLTHYSASAAHTLQVRYGASVVVLRESRAPVPALVGRFDDSPPYYGGDEIASNGHGCTSGPTVYGNAANNPWMLTAGHCSNAIGDTVVVLLPVKEMGHVKDRARCDHCLDGEKVDGSYARYIWTGGANSGASVYEDYGKPPAKGNYVTTDGMVTGEVRGNLVTNPNTTITTCDDPSDPSTCKVVKDVFRVQNIFGNTICHHGDSGSPIYSYEGSRPGAVIVRGILVAGAGSICYGERIDALEDRFNVHIADQ